MKKQLWPLLLFVLFVLASFTLVATTCDAGASKQDTAQTQKGEEGQYQQSGQPLYFDPDKAKGTHVDDAAPYSDPWYGKEEKYKGGHGSQAGPKGKVDDSKDVKVIEGPVRYERVKE